MLTESEPHYRQPLLKTPFHERSRALSQLDSFVPWAGYTTVDVFTSVEQEYFAIRNASSLYDLTPMVKYRVSGADALRFLNRLVTRDVRRLAPGTGRTISNWSRASSAWCQCPPVMRNSRSMSGGVKSSLPWMQSRSAGACAWIVSITRSVKACRCAGQPPATL